MCGIAGIVSLTSAREVEAIQLSLMRDEMIHRGPDGGGMWISPDKRAGLAHRRLAIVDLSVSAEQPMSNEAGTIWVTFNGEIYNHLALRAQLIDSGHRFQTDHSDTEVLVHGYEEWGIEGLAARLEGDFAFGIWDEVRGRLCLVRDPIGVKPLYVSATSGAVVFASEIKALFRSGLVEKRPNLSAIGHYLSFLTTPAPETLFHGVFKLPAGYILSAERNKGINASRYWDALPGQSGVDVAGEAGNDDALEQLLVEEIRRRLIESVKLRMMSDVPFGALLSGGIDSSANLALMAQFARRPVETFTVGYSEVPEMNEFVAARRAAKEWGANHHEVMITENDTLDYLSKLVYSQDEPLADWVCVPLYFVSRLAHDAGVRVVQVGEGADEQFIGYPHYKKYAAIDRAFWRPFAALPASAQRCASRAMSSVARLWPDLELHAEFVDRALRHRELFWCGSTTYWDHERAKVLRSGWERFDRIDAEGQGLGAIIGGGAFTPDTYSVVHSIYESFDRQVRSGDFYPRMIYNEFKLRLPELLLMRVDKITMSMSLEARVPFLDRRLVELSMDIPDRFRVKRGHLKHMLKRAVTGIVPNDILERPKVGFDAPVRQWLRGNLGLEAERVINRSWFARNGLIDQSYVQKLFAQHRTGHDRASRIWALFNLCAWYECWFP